MYAPNVVSNTCVEKYGILWDYANGLTQAGLGDVTDILSVNEDTALILFQVIKSIEKTEDCRLSRSRLANESHRSSFGDTEGNTTQCGLAAIVREAYIVCNRFESIT